MVINIKNILLYYYDINTLDYEYISINNYFMYNNNYYILKEIKKYDINFLFNISKIRIISSIVKNKYNELISNYNNKMYALVKVNVSKLNRDININDLLSISCIDFYMPILKINYYELWSKKIDYIDSYNYEYLDNNYYIGLSNIALNLIKNINFNNITYKLTYKRFYSINTLYDILDPFNIKLGPIVNGFAEYIKYNYFFKNIKVEYEKILNIYLNIDDYILFIARLIFPTYYFDLLNQNDTSYNSLYITKNIDGYLEYIKEIIKTIKKRSIKLSFFENIINLL